MSGVSAWLTAAAVAATGLGVVVGVLVAVASRELRTGLRCALELWLGAGLLRLGSTHTWAAALTAGVVLALRQVVGRELRRSAAARRPAR